MPETRHNIHRRTTLALGLAWTLGTRQALAADPPALAGRVKLTTGTASVLRPLQALTQAEAGIAVYEGDLLVTGANSEMHLVMEDAAYLAMRPDTRLRITRYQVRAQAEDRTWLEMVKGGLRTVSGWVAKANPHAFRLSSPVATIGIRGTDFEVQHHETQDAPAADQAGTHHLVREGITLFATEAGQLTMTAGMAAHASNRHAAPQAYADVPSFLSVQLSPLEAAIQEHIANLSDLMTAKLQERGLLNPGENWSQRLERFQQDNPASAPALRDDIVRTPERPDGRRNGPRGAGGAGGGGGGRR